MNRTRSLAAAILLAAAAAAQADTQSLNVTASVKAVCKFSSAVQTLAFGSLDPSAGTTATGSGAAVTYRCTKGTTAAGVTAGDGNHFTGGKRHMSNGTDVIPYTLTLGGDTHVGTGFGSGENKSLTISGEVAGADYANVSAGDYTDTVLLTITP